TNAAVQARGRLVVFGQILADVGIVGQVRRHDYLGRIVFHLRSVVGELLVVKTDLGAMRIDVADHEEERFFAGVRDEFSGTLGDAGNVAAGALADLGVPVINRGGTDVHFADDAGVVARHAQESRQTLHPGVRLLAMRRVLQAV